MIFNKHSELEGRHSFLSPSKYHWINYDEDNLIRSYKTAMAARRGTELHEWAAQAIRLNQKLSRNNKTINRYVNDAIGYRMTPELALFYSVNCFGTVDAISFRNNLLRVHDLKTGVTPTSMLQLKAYAAIFCLEYRFKPFDIDMELRIYQNDDVQILIPDPDEIFHIMDKIITHDKMIEMLKEEDMS